MIDLDFNREQLLGSIPSEVLQRLWPQFEPQNREVYVNPVLLRRHLQSKPDYMTRVAAFNVVCERLDGCLTSSAAYSRYDSIPETEAGINVFIEAPDPDSGASEFFMLGIRLLKRKAGGGRRNYVATVLPLMSRERMEKKLARARAVLIVDANELKETD